MSHVSVHMSHVTCNTTQAKEALKAQQNEQVDLSDALPVDVYMSGDARLNDAGGIIDR